MIVWEYRSVSASTNALKQFVDELNQLGLEGWEMTGFASADKTVGLNSMIAILRRGREGLSQPPAETPEGWVRDPSGRYPDRYWSGAAWTKWVRDEPGGNRSEDPPFGPVLDAR